MEENNKEGQSLKIQITNSVNVEGTNYQGVLSLLSIQTVNVLKFEEFLKGLGFVNIDESADRGNKKKAKGKK